MRGNLKVILTHPFLGNYGGMLQAYALFKILSSFKENVKIIKYEANYLPVNFRSCFRYFKQYIKYLFGISQNSYQVWSKLSIARKFSRKVTFLSELKLAKLTRNDSFVVGSDQVWRPEYCKYLKSTPFFFLNFASKEQRSNSIAYAASFGVDTWEASEDETLIVASLLRDFKSVSVREHSGVKICREKFGVDAVRMPDPTLLLSCIEYEKIMQDEKRVGGGLAAYILDESLQIAKLLDVLSCSMNMRLIHMMPRANASRMRERLDMSVSRWLRTIHDCSCFVTDSFHGCVFAIIFNKPFVCLGNTLRGNTRFDSLLSIYGLESRMVSSGCFDDILRIMREPIDWMKVNAIRESERKMGIEFLKNNLT